jgi:hypothetical protein
MRMTGNRFRGGIAFGLAIILAMPLAETAAALPQQTISGQQRQSVSPAQEQTQDSAGQGPATDADSSKSDATSTESPAPVQSQTAAQNGPSAATQSSAEQQEDTSPKPVGTAAAPYEKTTGVAASRPAGAVIAPAKQRRARSILIRVSIVVGAAVAVGTVVALSRSSPSRPN